MKLLTLAVVSALFLASSSSLQGYGSADAFAASPSSSSGLSFVPRSFRGGSAAEFGRASSSSGTKMSDSAPPSSKKIRTLESTLSLSAADADAYVERVVVGEEGGGEIAPEAQKTLVDLAAAMTRRAQAGEPLTDSELDDAVASLQNVVPASAKDDIDWAALRTLYAASGHLSHKVWETTGKSASTLRGILLGKDEDGGLSETFRSMFGRVLSEGNWDGAASHADEHSRDNKPWAVLVTGVNGIRKTTSMYQPWAEELLQEALVKPSDGEHADESSEQKLPTGENSFFRQLDHMIATLANADFQRMYTLTDEGASVPPAPEDVQRYSDYKAAIFARYRTLSEILGILLVREARRLKSNVMIETSGRDVAMFHYVDSNFPKEDYNKLALHFTIDDLSGAERSVDTRMVGEIAAGIEALKQGSVKDIIHANAGGPYGSEVLAGVQADSDRVWEKDVIGDGSEVGSDWYKATIAITSHVEEDWTARAVRPEGSDGTVFTFGPPPSKK